MTPNQKHTIEMLEAITSNLSENIQIGHTTAARIGVQGYPGGEGQRFPSATLVVPNAAVARTMRRLYGTRALGLNQPEKLRMHKGAMVFDAAAVDFLARMALTTIRELIDDLEKCRP